MTLSPREVEILSLVSDGVTNKKIGERLFISEYTVKTHRQNIIHKLGTSKITDLIKISLFFDLISN